MVLSSRSSQIRIGHLGGWTLTLILDQIYQYSVISHLIYGVWWGSNLKSLILGKFEALGKTSITPRWVISNYDIIELFNGGFTDLSECWLQWSCLKCKHSPMMGELGFIMRFDNLEKKSMNF